MDRKLAIALVVIHNDLNPSANDEATVCENYSGRGMFGHLTTGITGVTLSDLLSSLIVALTTNPESTLDQLNLVDLSEYARLVFKTDDFGRGQIIY
jgi:hypothetical protein